MSYEWEAGISDLLQEMEDLLPEGFALVGAAIANMQAAEGALLDHAGTTLDRHGRSCVIEADIRKDILADADAQYEQCRSQLFTEKRSLN